MSPFVFNELLPGFNEAFIQLSLLNKSADKEQVRFRKRSLILCSWLIYPTKLA